MNDDKEVTVTVTPEDMEFRARAKAAGLPDILISMYGAALRKLIADEREACAKVCDAHESLGDGYMGDHFRECAAEIRARGKG